MERIEDGSSMNIVPPMFHAGISSKFTKRHGGNFRDTTLTAASAAKQRAELKLERQADAIEKQQQKIDKEMKKIAEITQNLHRQQLREAKRLRNRLNYSASKIQTAYRRHLVYVNHIRRDAAVAIQTLSRRFLARQLCWRLRLEREAVYQNCSSRIISRCIRRFTARNIRCREIKRQYWAACSIQCMIRVTAARTYVQERRRQREEAELQHQAAIVIQCNTRSFMTRLIYLDVLYLICRIQAAMRGCLVRRHLRWLRVSDVDAITQLQAHIRGFLVRRRMEFRGSGNSSTRSKQGSTQKMEQATQANLGVSRLKFQRAASFSFANGEIPSLVRSSTGRGWQPTTEPVIKRSYWLPAGASFDKRLPVLPVPKRMKALNCGDSLGDELEFVNRNWTPKKRPHQKPCPVRLSPVVIPTANTEVCDPGSSGFNTEDVHFLENEERLRRQEELKQKLQVRRNQERRQQESELKLKREAENESNERKLMEREEKAVRLQLKILRRRSREGRIRQVTADQRREERERLAMTREERHVRLHMKFCARQHAKKRQQLAATASETESQPPSTSSSRHERQRSSAPRTRKSKSTSKKTHHVSSDDDGDMSFLDINFTIPSSMKTRKQLMMPPAPPEDLEDDCGYGDEFDEVVDEEALGQLIC
eukprot:jgi/Phyca11/116993/e_gw1.32.157.1